MGLGARTAVRQALRRIGVIKTPAPPSLLTFIRNREVDLVIDVGANKGQFGGDLRRGGFRGKIVSFEPLHSEFEELARAAQADGNWEAHNFALGDSECESSIFVSEFSVFSSLRPSTRAATHYDTKAQVLRSETIEVKTLDEAVKNFTGRTLLKIDTQGYEKQVLDGGGRTLARVEGVFMEVPIIQLYQGNWRIDEAFKYMAALGFVPAQIHAVNYHSRDSDSMVEADVLFRPLSEIDVADQEPISNH